MKTYSNEPDSGPISGKELLRKIAGDFVGLDTVYPTVSGRKRRRVYMDSTASTLMMGVAHRTMSAFLEHYANTHSVAHNGATLATEAFRQAHERILDFVNADPQQYTCFFAGSGTTAGINRLSRVYRDLRPDKDTAVVSIMEHHSNDLPHRKHMDRVIHLPAADTGTESRLIDLVKLEEVLKAEKGRVNYVAITGVSNVTGFVNPVYDIAAIAHAHDALIIIDGAQMAAHLPITMSGHADSGEDLDGLVFSGHKTYVPGSPGVVIAKKEHLAAIEPDEVGGGIVDRVSEERYVISPDFPEREEAGTPNIPGAIGLAVVVDVLGRIGMDVLAKEEDHLLKYALDRMSNLEQVRIYGCLDTEACPRVASIAFNVGGVSHALVAAMLNDYHNIAVRNECFCAHPYVMSLMPGDSKRFREMSDEEWRNLKGPKPGMVRASFGLYNTKADADRLITALEDLIEHQEHYLSVYELGDDHVYRHPDFRLNHDQHFSIDQQVAKELG
ncbi:MAG: aminotransferase class V-fold PLP-dependent enzyme [Candidatus Marinimicrobia bacterium]|nr:aminotransferase class V-fold PLP-dependent enzyme [Candidatus Neomarinimicrobiota bacterium]